MRIYRGGRKNLCGAVLVLTACFGLRAQVPGKKPQLRLTAVLDRSTVRLGEKIPITFHVQNVSIRNVTITMTEPGYDISLSMVDGRNRGVPFTKFGEAMQHGLRIIAHGQAETLMPGGESRFALDLAEYYEIRRPGVYFIEGTYNGLVYLDPSRPGQKARVASKRVKVMVVQ